MSLLTLDPKDPAPLYQQIARGLEQAIREGRLQPGDKLPTVRELSRELSAAGGTVKRAYEELCRRGLLVMAQGKGTFVALPDAQDSRKERAMAAIDAMLDRMEALAFSQQEVQIFLDLKLRERMRERGLRVAVVDCCPEGLRMLTDKLYGLCDAALYPLLLEKALGDLDQLTGEMDLVVTTDTHLGQLSALLEGQVPLLGLCLRPSDSCLMALARLDRGLRVGILSQDQAFARFSRELCLRCSPDCVIQGACPPQAALLSRLLSCCDALLVPMGFEQSCPPEVLRTISAFAAAHPLVRLELEPDLGSLRTLERQLAALGKNSR